MPDRRGVLLGAGLLLAATACAGPGEPAAERPTVTVFAAGSLTDSFTELKRSFAARNPTSRSS